MPPRAVQRRGYRSGALPALTSDPPTDAALGLVRLEVVSGPGAGRVRNSLGASKTGRPEGRPAVRHRSAAVPCGYLVSINSPLNPWFGSAMPKMVSLSGSAESTYEITPIGAWGTSTNTRTFPSATWYLPR